MFDRPSLACLDIYLYMRFSRYDYGTYSLGSDGDKGIRTLDPLLARQVLSHLSYTPVGLPPVARLTSLIVSAIPLAMGLSGLEPPTSRLSGVRSNRLSYKPLCTCMYSASPLSLFF